MRMDQVYPKREFTDDSPVSEIAARLGEHAEALCRELLPNGHKDGAEDAGAFGLGGSESAGVLDAVLIRVAFRITVEGGIEGGRDVLSGPDGVADAVTGLASSAGGSLAHRCEVLSLSEALSRVQTK